MITLSNIMQLWFVLVMVFFGGVAVGYAGKLEKRAKKETYCNRPQ